MIGLGDGNRYEQQTVRLEVGDRVLLYTDGVLENRAAAGESYGRDRFGRAVRQAAHRQVDALVPALHAAIREFLAGAAPDDDISILGLEYTGEDLEHYTI